MARQVMVPLDVLFGFRLDPGLQPGTVLLRLMYRSVSDVQSETSGRPKEMALVLLDEQVRELAEALSGKSAATPPGDRDGA
jgi:hypothetical protein